MTREGAEEFFAYNIDGAHVKGGPIFMDLIEN